MMNTVTFYMTESFGGMEGRDLEERKFKTEGLARLNALNDTWNERFTLYKVTMTFDGAINEKKELIGEIKSGRDIEYLKALRENLDEVEKAIEEINGNTRLKETTKAKRLAEEKTRLDRYTRIINNILKKG